MEGANEKLHHCMKMSNLKDFEVFICCCLDVARVSAEAVVVGSQAKLVTAADVAASAPMTKHSLIPRSVR